MSYFGNVLQNQYGCFLTTKRKRITQEEGTHIPFKPLVLGLHMETKYSGWLIEGPTAHTQHSASTQPGIQERCSPAAFLASLSVLESLPHSPPLIVNLRDSKAASLFSLPQYFQV